jgi:hypothetical protein
LDIFDWYQGKLSSRRLLVLLRYLPDDSPFKVAYFRDWPDEYDWPREDHLTTGVWNEIKAMRGDLWAFLGKERLAFRPVLTPSAQREQDKKRQLQRAGHDSIIAQIGGEV